MKKIDLVNLDISCYTEKLDNGLEVFMLPYENKNNYFISYATRFGSDILEFDLNGKSYTPHAGIAHFLEHKMFEQENGEDPFTYFSASGTDANASTSFDNTQYICYGTKNFNANLRYLIQYVNSPYYTDSNVNKEKGIIAEEINMYEDMPDFKLEMKLRECIYNASPRRIDIAGTVDEINKITKEDLYNCYNNFYTPNNMFILIVGKFSIDDALEIIKEELGNKESIKLPKIGKVKENDSVNKKELTIKENVKVPKIALGLKIPTKNLNLKGLELDIYLNMLTTIIFGSSSEFRERVRNEKLLSSIYTEWENTCGFRTYYLMASTVNPDKLIEEIKEEIKNMPISLKNFNRIKKVWIANEVKMIDNIDATVNNLYDDILKYKKVIPNKVDVIRNMKIEKLNELVENIDFDNISIVKMIDKEK
jgi:predicted Zn-dependent peptidase